MSYDTNVNFNLKANDEASSVFQNVGKQMDNMEKGANSISKAFEVAAGVMLRDFAQGALNATVNTAKQASDQFVDFDTSLNRIRLSAGLTADETKLLGSTMQQTSSQWGLGLQDVAAASAILADDFKTAEEIGVALNETAKLSVATNTNAARATDILSSALKAFGLEATDAEKVVDLMVATSYASGLSLDELGQSLKMVGPVAGAMGMKMEEVNTALGVFKAAGISGGEAGTALRRIIVDLSAPTGAARDEMEKLGIAVFDNEGSFRGLGPIVADLEKALECASEEQKTLTLQTIFSTNALAAINVLVGEGSAGWDDMANSLDRSGLATDSATDLMDTYGGKLASAEQRIVIANQALGQMTAQLKMNYKEWVASLGPIGGVIDAFGPTMLQGALTGVMMLMPKIIASLYAKTAALGVTATASKLAATGIGILKTALTFLAAHPIILVIMGIIVALTALWHLCPPFREAVIAVGEAVAKWFGDAFQWVAERLTAFWENVLVPFGEWLKGGLQKIWEGLTTAWGTFYNIYVKPVWEALDWAWNSLLVPFGRFLSGAFQGIWEGLCSAWNIFYDTYIKPVWVALEWAWNNLLKPFGVFLEGALSDAWKGICFAWEAFYKGYIEPVWVALEWFWSNVLTPFSSWLGGTLGSAWEDLCSSWSNFYNSYIAPVWNALQNFWDTVLIPFGIWLIGTLGKTWEHLCTSWSRFYTSYIQPIWNALTDFWNRILIPFGNWLIGSLLSAWNTLTTSISNFYNRYVVPVWTSLQNFWNNVLIPLRREIVERLQTAWQNFASAFQNFYNRFIAPVINALRNAYNQVLRPIGDILGTIQRGLSGAVSNVTNFFKGLKIPGFAEGGIVYKPTLAVVGEKEPELIVPFSKLGMIQQPVETGRKESGVPTQYIKIYPTINIYGDVGTQEDIANLKNEIDAEMSESLRRVSY